jgi:CBS domain-containing protein
MKLVREFMNPSVITFSPDDTIFKVAKIFSENDISGAPVVESRKVVGVISESDLVKYMSFKMGRSSSPSTSLSMLFLGFIRDNIEIKSQLKRLSKIKIRDFMSKSAVHIGPDCTLLEAACIMEKNDINRLPVVEDGKLVGIIARSDLIKALVK